MSEEHLLTGAYALDALDDVERLRFERHLSGCATCLTEVREFREAAAALAERVAVPPPDALYGRVAAQIARTRQEHAGRMPGRRPIRWRGLAAAAATVLLAGSAGLGGLAWRGHREADEARARATAIARVMSDPGRVEVSGTSSLGGRASVVAAARSAVFSTDRLPAAPDGRTYQVWVIEPDGIRSAGLLQLRGGTGQALVTGVEGGDSIAVSVEPDGGSEQPTTTPILALKVT